MKIIDRYCTLRIQAACGAHLMDHTASKYIIFFLNIQVPKFVILYRNYRKSSDAHCSQQIQKVAAQGHIQCIFQLLHVPVRQRYIEFLEDIIDGIRQSLKVLLLSTFAVVGRKCFQKYCLYCTLFNRRLFNIFFAIKAK